MTKFSALAREKPEKHQGQIHRLFFKGAVPTMPSHQGDHFGGNLAADIADLRARMLTVEAGVANFKKFQEGANEFFHTFKATQMVKAEVDAKRASIHFWLLSALVAVVGALATALFEGHHF